MSRYLDQKMLEPPTKPSACSTFLRFTWKTISCIFSHIFLVSLVVLYCILGAKTFETLEREHEKEVKKNIINIRQNITEVLWAKIQSEPLFREENFTEKVLILLQDFEIKILHAMNKDGWDGDENEKSIQWTFAGALFYSIIVITTIGYGHIAPKTTWGKVVTIFYAILGIPLMLLCLSNIGDVMATSFRFIYWRVCCYICTKKPKKPKRTRTRGGTIRRDVGRGGSYRSNKARSSLRRSVRMSTRSADSGFDYGETIPSSHSDTELRYLEDLPPMKVRGASLPRMRPTAEQNRYRFREITAAATPAINDNGQSDLTQAHQQAPLNRTQQRGGSLDRRRTPKAWDPTLDLNNFPDAPVLCNKYVVDFPDPVPNHMPREGIRRSFERSSPSTPARRAVSMPRSQNYLEPPHQRSSTRSADDLNVENVKKTKRDNSPSSYYNYQYSHQAGLVPGNYVAKRKYASEREEEFEEEMSDVDYYYEEEMFSLDGSRSNKIRPVPIWLCVFLVVGYIFAGAFLFSTWESWNYLDSAYFCFITLTTIGFGDFVPAKRVTENAEMSIALCSLYLLFGISLLAMSFNLVQEEVIASVKNVAKTLGIIKNDDVDDEDNC